MKIENTAGKIWYGLHFYPGVAEYGDSHAPRKDGEPYRVYLNEDTIRRMDPSFAGKPVFVEHVEEVEQSLDQLRKEADGWVVESFFNAADGKHWCKFITVTDRADRAIKNGFKLSNAYVPQLNGKSGLWNAVTYQDEVVSATYEHLAIVREPRYQESVILTPDEFKSYNDNLQTELKRISNSIKEAPSMGKLLFCNKKPIDNSLEIENLFVTLPKSRKEYTIGQLVNAMDDWEEKKKENAEDDKKMKEDCQNKKKNEDEEESDVEAKKKKVEVEGDMKNADDEDEDKKEMKKNKKKNEESEDEDKKEMAKEKMDKKSNSISDGSHYNSLKNAPDTAPRQEVAPKLDLPGDSVARGKARYGS